MSLIQFKLTGFKELEKKLTELGPKIAKKGLRLAVFSGAGVIKEGMIRGAPERTGLLKKSVSIFKRRTPPSKATYAVGFRRIAQKFGNTAKNRRRNRVGKRYYVDNPAYYARFLEYGTSKMPAQPFVRPALENGADPAIEAMRESLETSIATAAKGRS